MSDEPRIGREARESAYKAASVHIRDVIRRATAADIIEPIAFALRQDMFLIDSVPELVGYAKGVDTTIRHFQMPEQHRYILTTLLTAYTAEVFSQLGISPAHSK